MMCPECEGARLLVAKTLLDKNALRYRKLYCPACYVEIYTTEAELPDSKARFEDAQRAYGRERARNRKASEA